MKRQRTLREEIADEVIEDVDVGTHDVYGGVLPAAFNGVVVSWGDLDDDGYRKSICVLFNEWKKQNWIEGDASVFLRKVMPSRKDNYLMRQMKWNGINSVMEFYDEMEDYKYAGWYMYTRLFFDWDPKPVNRVGALWRMLIQRKSHTAAWALICTQGTVERQRLMRWEVICFGVSWRTSIPILYVVNNCINDGMILLKK